MSGSGGLQVTPQATAVEGMEVLQREKAHEDCVLGVDTLAKDGLALMVSCGLDKTIMIWERTPPEPEAEIDNFENGMVGGDDFIGENGVDAETMDTVMKIEVVPSEQVDEAQ